jgi:hypothetical protein
MTAEGVLRNDQPASEPPQNLLIALVTQEPPQSIRALHFPEVALGNVGLRKKLRCISSGEVNTFRCTGLIHLPFETTDQSKLQNFLPYHAVSADLLAPTRRPEARRQLQGPRARNRTPQDALQRHCARRRPIAA